HRDDVLILHNPVMKQWFAPDCFRGAMVPLQLFRCLLGPGQNLPELPKEAGNAIVFAGGLGMEKSAFLYQIDGLARTNFTLELFGNGFKRDKVPADTVSNYQRTLAPDELLNQLHGKFGQSWNG